MGKPTKKDLLEALEKAVSVYKYASMTRWEREVCKDDMVFAEDVLSRSTPEQSLGSAR